MTVLYLQQKDIKKREYYLDVSPLVGRSKSVLLNRVKYSLSGRADNIFERISTDLRLPTLKGEEFGYELLFNNENELQLSVIKGAPFILNGNKCFKAIVGEGDSIFTGGNCFSLRLGDTDQEDDKLLIPRKIVESNMPIFLEGETGSGKSRLAKIIHDKSLRSRGQFISLNVSALSSSLLESELFGHVKGAFTGAIHEKKGAIISANKGTLFLDEVDSLPFSVQVKLLLFLDSLEIKPVGSDRWVKSDVRLIFATGTSIHKLLDMKKFRPDFFYRLDSSFSHYLPPLRENRSLISKFCRWYEKKYSVVFSKELIDFYTGFNWPGNYRQLKSHLDKKVMLSHSSKIQFDDLDRVIFSKQNIKYQTSNNRESVSLNDYKRKYVHEVLMRNRGNLKLTAVQLQISLSTVRSYIHTMKDNSISAA